MNIADKATLDAVYQSISRIGNYLGYKNTARSMRYYLPEGVKVICDRTKINVSQVVGTPRLIDEGYEISDTGIVTISTTGEYIEYAVYNLI